MNALRPVWYIPAVVLLSCPIPSCTAQLAGHSIRVARSNIADPVKVTAVLLDGHTVDAQRPFAADDKWLRDLSLQLSNRSHKTLVTLVISISFPDLGDGRTVPMTAAWIQVGQLPGWQRTRDGRTRPDLHSALRVTANSDVLIQLSKYESELRQAWQANGPHAPARCQIDLQAAYFQDGSKWTPGVFYRPDADKPGKYKVITREQFDSDADWAK